MYDALPIGAFLAALLVLVPLPWHWRARNVPTLSIIAWLFISNIVLAVNSIVWAGNFEIRAEVWCDIATKIHIGATMALPACCLCLCIHLERIASVRQVQTTPEQKRRRRVFDILLCWGLPCLTMALHYIVQGHRFDIVEDFGCKPAVYVSVPAILVLYVPILIVILATLLFASAALYHFFRRRVTFARHLQDAACYGPRASLSQPWCFTFRGGLRPWISWENVHSDFGRVGQFPRFLLPSSTWASVLFSFWIVPASSVLFFVFFAFGQDAVKEYRAVFGIARRVLRLPPKPEQKARLPSIPTFVARFPSTPTYMETKGRPSDAHTLRSSASTVTSATAHGLPSYIADDIPMTPQSASSFRTVIEAYETGDRERRHTYDSFYKPPTAKLPRRRGRYGIMLFVLHFCCRSTSIRRSTGRRLAPRLWLRSLPYMYYHLATNTVRYRTFVVPRLLPYDLRIGYAQSFLTLPSLCPHMYP
ncbi:Pheromone receptor Rcb2 B44 [Mycena chlorophos]|uniref:Pheromone receptor Rcb2 B44 n=1 Tax=Mycena chlorophos TaxID=658473 RepID=A0A8H6TPT3_MYCCL|nr:Pheromone receptor Rcb2 B44 [Mycena chlorophos]